MMMTAKPIQILLVADTPGDALFIKQALHAPRYNLNAVADSDQAIAYLHRQGIFAKAPQPDLILLDMRMPVMDGRAFVEAYRGIPEPHVPIVIITASKHWVEQARGLNVAYCLLKPFDWSALLDCVERYIGRM
jgi:CheY-like chemotaxis protein